MSEIIKFATENTFLFLLIAIFITLIVAQSLISIDLLGRKPSVKIYNPNYKPMEFLKDKRLKFIALAQILILILIFLKI